MSPAAPRPITVVTALLALSLAAGCASAEEREMSTIAARPVLEATVARYEEMQTRIRTGLDALLGPRPWRDGGNADVGDCGSSPGLGVRRILPMWTFDGGISDADWPRARDVVTSVAAEYGFTGAGATADRPASHDLGLVDPETQASISVGTQVNTVMQVTTGCHLPAAARPS